MIYDACAARYPGRDEPARMRHCYPSFYSRPRFPQYPYSNILDYGLRGISHPQLYTVVYRARHICAWTIASDPNPCSPGRRHIQSYTPFGSHTLRSLYTVRGPLWAVWGVLQRSPHLSHSLPFTHGSTGPLPSHIRTFRESSALHRTDSSRTLPSFDDDDLAWDG